MGLMDIVKKLLTGATDEENARNKARMRELFNECVPEGDQYTLIYCHMEDFTDAVVVKVTTHSNFIVGYKQGEVVVVPVDAELKGHEEPVVFNKENGGQIKSTLVGYCTASKPDVTFQFEPIICFQEILQAGVVILGRRGPGLWDRESVHSYSIGS